MWWLVYLVLCLVLMALPDRRLFNCLAFSALGLIAMQVFKLVDLDHWQWVSSAAVWAAVAIATTRHNIVFSVLTLISAMCYAWGRMGGYDFAPSPPLFWADMAWLAAVVITGGRCLVGTVIDAFRSSFAELLGNAGNPNLDASGRARLNRSADPLAQEAQK